MRLHYDVLHELAHMWFGGFAANLLGNEGLKNDKNGEQLYLNFLIAGLEADLKEIILPINHN